jgi:hypothetical protein
MATYARSAMKKVAIGCLVVLVLGGVVATAGMYWVYSRVTSAVSEFADLAEAARLDQNVTNQAPYSPPASGELTTEMIARLMTVQSDIRAALGPRFKEFEERYRDFAARLDKRDGQVPSPGDLVQLVSAYKDLGGLLLSAKKAQVDALNRSGFSAAEYSWVRNNVYAAAGVPGAAFNLSEIVDAVLGGSQPTQPGFDPMAGLKAPESNRKLVEPLKDRLMENYPLLVFGL